MNAISEEHVNLSHGELAILAELLESEHQADD